MFDEMRVICRELQDTFRKSTFPVPEMRTNARHLGLIQGLIVGVGLRSVVDTHFGIGFTTTAVGLAFRRLPPGSPCMYISAGDPAEPARYMFPYMSRRFPDWMSTAQVRIGSSDSVLIGLDGHGADLAIVHAEPDREQTLSLLKLAQRALRPEGLILVPALQPMTTPQPDGLEQWRQSQTTLNWIGESPCLLIQTRPT
jgi:hypothetical protein